MNREFWDHLIDESIETFDGLNIGDILTQNDENFKSKSKVIGFDSGGCPFVEYMEVWYNQENAPDDGDKIEVGNVIPFPWSDPRQYRLIP